MENLWAPWRLNYVKDTDKKKDSCVFCLDPSSADAEERLVLQWGKTCFVIMNIYPYNNGHILIVPYRHVNDFCSLTSEEKIEMIDLISLWVKIEKSVMMCHGFNVGINLGEVAGAGIKDHLHFHMVPRWQGDTNFMPVVSKVKVIPQSLEDTYKALKSKFEEIGNAPVCEK